MNGGWPRVPMINRILIDERGCWNWTGCVDKNGYGVKSYAGKRQLVHRLAAHFWLKFNLSSSLFVLHCCDNPRCFNPKHLFIGTQIDNMQDCIRKKRQANVAKTHCVNGHLLSSENSYGYHGRRQCKICARRKAFEQRQRLKEKNDE